MVHFHSSSFILTNLWTSGDYRFLLVSWCHKVVVFFFFWRLKMVDWHSNPLFLNFRALFVALTVTVTYFKSIFVIIFGGDELGTVLYSKFDEFLLVYTSCNVTSSALSHCLIACLFWLMHLHGMCLLIPSGIHKNLSQQHYLTVKIHPFTSSICLLHGCTKPNPTSFGLNVKWDQDPKGPVG